MADGDRPILGLTLGDPAGIGPEMARRAIAATGVDGRSQVRVFVAAELLPWSRRALAGCTVQWVPVSHVAAAGAGLATDPTPGRPTPAGLRQSFCALEAMASAAAAGQLDAMVTGPVPKGIFGHLDPRPPGQTEYLAARLGAQRFAMMLAGPRLRVVPVTTHVPLRAVPELLTVDGIVDCGLAATAALRDWLLVPRPRLAVCGLNPHAGEGGTLGDEEARVIAPAVARLQGAGVAASGPVVADTAFHFALHGHYDAVLCMYHDQALGPLKTVHFADGYNLTCGLPVARVSPDHGTAYDLAGTGRADPTSFASALLLAEHIARRRAPAQFGESLAN
ncbi:MAG: 4-hydroxythreonine-4-phosphate dehydrogenase PdxA [Deltaproteobacteria bacterium]|nr:4-hydroxythreonine-4-phosphate dehydrogenase PdxA [Deltaproteobacteria bacterium]